MTFLKAEVVFLGAYASITFRLFMGVTYWYVNYHLYSALRGQGDSSERGFPHSPALYTPPAIPHPSSPTNTRFPSHLEKKKRKGAGFQLKPTTAN